MSLTVVGALCNAMADVQELANSQSFLKELCDVLGVPHPDPTVQDATANKYVFEKAVEFNNGDGTVSLGRIDLYRAGCFVLESKQGSERKAAEKAEALATVTRTAKKRIGTAERGTAGWECEFILKHSKL